MTTTTDHTYVVGDTVTYAGEDSSREPVGSYYRFIVYSGLTGEVTRVTTNKYLVKFPVDPDRNAQYYSPGATAASVWVDKSEVSPADPDAPKPRKLGDVPEGDISPDDPRLAWLWADAAKAATQARHCAEYDTLCDKFGIPGREREFTVNYNIGDLKVSAKIKATSQKVANELFAQKLKAAK
jgi:hypothetical protein